MGFSYSQCILHKTEDEYNSVRCVSLADGRRNFPFSSVSDHGCTNPWQEVIYKLLWLSSLYNPCNVSSFAPKVVFECLLAPFLTPECESCSWHFCILLLFHEKLKVATNFQSALNLSGSVRYAKIYHCILLNLSFPSVVREEHIIKIVKPCRRK